MNGEAQKSGNGSQLSGETLMKLFHTRDRVIREPDIYAGRKNADFGQGFYLSEDEDFAGSWARERTASGIYVNVYELDTSGMKFKTLGRDAEWFRYIYSNRRGGEDMLRDYDVISGPVAVDTLFETYGIITSGLLTEEQSLTLLSIGRTYSQTVIKTPEGLSGLKWVDAYTLDEDMIRSARAKYDSDLERFENRFAELLDSFQ